MRKHIKTSYFKYLFIQQPCPKHGNTFCADHCIVSSQQIQGLYLLTVQVECHRLVLHTVCYSVPSESAKTEWALISLSFQGVIYKYFVFTSCPQELTKIPPSQTNPKYLWVVKNNFVKAKSLQKAFRKHLIPFEIRGGQAHWMSSTNQNV